MRSTALRIGCGCGFWGDSAAGPAQLVRHGDLDVLVLDYLSEITLSLLARARRKRPELGYTPDFIDAVMRPLAAEIAARGIKVIANAGGVNPRACAAALRAVLGELGVPLTVAVVLGDDVSDELARLRASGVTDLESGRPLPVQVASANAYLGAFPIAQALKEGAQVIITGRCADSALALAPLIHAFGWRASELDRLALGSLAGHIIECGPQATGGIFTDWPPSGTTWATRSSSVPPTARLS
jgi:Acyclic terpene utilisation family protein AtuA